MQYKKIAAFAVIFVPALLCSPTWADLVWPGPRPVAAPAEPGAANLSQLAGSPCVRMVDATVDIDLRPTLHNKRAPSICIDIKASFRMCSDSLVSETMTVGFPVSDHSYSGARLGAFSVNSNGEPKTLSTWPQQTDREEMKSDGKRRREATEGPPSPSPEPIGASPRPAPEPVLKPNPVPPSSYAGEIARESLNRDMQEWEETFAPREERIIDVHYELDIASQPKGEVAERIKGGKATWIPFLSGKTEFQKPVDLRGISALLDSLPDGRYYFFDYFLVSGATWKGSIGKEKLLLHLSDDFKDMQVLCNQPERLKQEDPTTWAYVLDNEEPTENLYFALPVGAHNNSLRASGARNP